MKTTVSFRVDSDTKARAQKVARDFGIPLSAVVNAKLDEFAREQTLEFRPSIKLATMLKQGEVELKAKKVSPTFKNAKDAVKWLRTGK